MSHTSISPELLAAIQAERAYRNHADLPGAIYAGSEDLAEHLELGARNEAPDSFHAETMRSGANALRNMRAALSLPKACLQCNAQWLANRDALALEAAALRERLPEAEQATLAAILAVAMPA